MSYMALYRKYRPVTFGKVIGQEHIVRALHNQMKTERISHAYLFCGTRGTGKTSMAKLLARAINCTSPIDSEPCNECEMCQAAMSGTSMNVIEIDAASNNGVDNIRELIEEVKYSPTKGKYKVYIIDEVHMLSAGAFNALLKTLEEPPAYVVFILATTEPQKVPITILSRCQRFDFRRISALDIAKTLKEYLLKENIEVNEDAILYIAQLAEGSMRDSLSILDQCISFYSDEVITIEKVLEVVGSVDKKVFFSITDALIKKDIRGLMDLIEKLIEQGRDVSQFIAQWIGHFRNLLICATINDTLGILDVSKEHLESLKEQAKLSSSEELIYYIKVFSELHNELKYASNERILLEVALLKLCSNFSENNMESILARMSQLEKMVENGIEINTSSKNHIEIPQKKEKLAPRKKSKAVSEDMKAAIDKWHEIKREFDPVLNGKLDHVEIASMEDDKLYLLCDYEALVTIIERCYGEIEEKLAQKLGKAFIVKAIFKDEYKEWHIRTHGEQEQIEEDKEFESLLGFFSDEDIRD